VLVGDQVSPNAFPPFHAGADKTKIIFFLSEINFEVNFPALASYVPSIDKHQDGDRCKWRAQEQHTSIK
jgi:hypothetical protein